jgi:hypothetical protein
MQHYYVCSEYFNSSPPEREKMGDGFNKVYVKSI